MIGLTVLVLLALGLFVLFAGGFAVMMAIKAILWLVLLPFRILLGILFLPLLLIKLVVGTIVFAVLGPILAIVLVCAAIAGIVALAVPLLPLLCIAFVVWAVMRSSRPAVA